MDGLTIEQRMNYDYAKFYKAFHDLCKEEKIEGISFHPESILNFIREPSQEKYDRLVHEYYSLVEAYKGLSHIGLRLNSA